MQGVGTCQDKSQSLNSRIYGSTKWLFPFCAIRSIYLSNKSWWDDWYNTRILAMVQIPYCLKLSQFYFYFLLTSVLSLWFLWLSNSFVKQKAHTTIGIPTSPDREDFPWKALFLWGQLCIKLWPFGVYLEGKMIFPNSPIFKVGCWLGRVWCPISTLAAIWDAHVKDMGNDVCGSLP